MRYGDNGSSKRKPDINLSIFPSLSLAISFSLHTYIYTAARGKQEHDVSIMSIYIYIYTYIFVRFSSICSPIGYRRLLLFRYLGFAVTRK